MVLKMEAVKNVGINKIAKIILFNSISLTVYKMDTIQLFLIKSSF